MRRATEITEVALLEPNRRGMDREWGGQLTMGFLAFASRLFEPIDIFSTGCFVPFFLVHERRGRKCTLRELSSLNISFHGLTILI